LKNGKLSRRKPERRLSNKVATVSIINTVAILLLLLSTTYLRNLLFGM
jgi:hypothetical protein